MGKLNKGKVFCPECKTVRSAIFWTRYDCECLHCGFQWDNTEEGETE